MSEALSPLNIVVIGAGLIGERHARLIAQLSEFELCAIIDPSQSSKLLSEELSSRHFSDLSIFLDRENQCDGVIIATPNETHCAFALACFDTAQLRNFAKMIRCNAYPLVSVKDGLQSVRIVEAIHRSAKEGHFVTIPAN